MNRKKKNTSDAFTPEEPSSNIQTDPEEKDVYTDEIDTEQEEDTAYSEESQEEEGFEEVIPEEEDDEEDFTAGDEEASAEDEEEHDEDAEDKEEYGEDDEEYDDAEEITDEDEGDPEDMPLKKKRRRRGRRKKEKKPMGKKPWIIAGSILGGLLVIYLGISAYFIGHFYMNTTINGKNFSGKTAEAVEEYMKKQVQDYELTIIEQNNEKDTISGDDISLTYKENSDIDDALKSQNPLLWPKAFFSKSTENVTIEVGYDENALNEQIQSIKAVTQEQTDPVSAYPKFDGETFVVEPEVYGTKVDKEMLTQKITQYITEFKSELNMLEEECYALPKYTSESPEVQEACNEMNELIKASITYKMDKDVVVDKELISTWVKYNDKMEVSLDEDAVKEWLREFGKTYDTVGKTRTITTPTGKTAEVSGGTYGWSVDEKAEREALIESIKKGETIEKEPAYEQTAASRGAQDWGSTYVEVDLSNQYMWYIVDGAVALETDVVTGLPTPNRQTPAGVYSILEMKRDKTLVGETDPATGEPIYETPVSYWMRVTWTGIGFHDANWQSSFGGSRYQSYGSHGCINMPVSQAASLYGMLSVGTPVIIHY